MGIASLNPSYKPLTRAYRSPDEATCNRGRILPIPFCSIGAQRAPYNFLRMLRVFAVNISVGLARDDG